MDHNASGMRKVPKWVHGMNIRRSVALPCNTFHLPLSKLLVMYILGEQNDAVVP